MTAAPSAVPTLTPSSLPTSQIPSAAPTITGAVVFIDLQKPVIATLTDDDVAEIIALAENEFGIFPGNVEAEVAYDISGTVDVVFYGDYTDEELTSALQSSIANTLNVHLKSD